MSNPISHFLFVGRFLIGCYNCLALPAGSPLSASGTWVWNWLALLHPHTLLTHTTVHHCDRFRSQYPSTSAPLCNTETLALLPCCAPNIANPLIPHPRNKDARNYSPGADAKFSLYTYSVPSFSFLSPQEDGEADCRRWDGRGDRLMENGGVCMCTQFLRK